jgi:hypothetical protein
VPRQADGDHGGTAGRTDDPDAAVNGLNALAKPGQASTRNDPGPSAAIVSHFHQQLPVLLGDVDRYVAGSAVLGDVG